MRFIDFSQLEIGRETTTEFLHKLHNERRSKEQEAKMEGCEEILPDVEKENAWRSNDHRNLE